MNIYVHNLQINKEKVSKVSSISGVIALVYELRYKIRIKVSTKQCHGLAKIAKGPPVKFVKQYYISMLMTRAQD